MMLYKYIFDPTATNPDISNFTNNLVVGDRYVLTNQMGESVELELKGFSHLAQHPIFQLIAVNLIDPGDIYRRLGEFNLFNGIKVIDQVKIISDIDRNRKTYLQENKKKLLEYFLHRYEISDDDLWEHNSYLEIIRDLKIKSIHGER